MDGIFFLVLAFLTVITSIKLSYYGDELGKRIKGGAVIIGGLLIASITSLPEFVTSISAVMIDNLTLSFGDILGSNMFNIFVLAVYNIYFFKSDIFKYTSKKYILECFILLIDYLFIILACKNILVNACTFISIGAYIVYFISVMKGGHDEEDSTPNQEKYVIIKFILCGLFMIILSTMLTVEADKLSHLYPKFSSSTIGAILLGITTSLPEVVTTFALLKLGNINMAISNMLGSNIFNFLVLAVADIISHNSIYLYVDSYSMYYVFGGLLITILFMSNLLKKFDSKMFYILISIVMILLYFRVWYLQFI